MELFDENGRPGSFSLNVLTECCCINLTAVNLLKGKQTTDGDPGCEKGHLTPHSLDTTGRENLQESFQATCCQETIQATNGIIDLGVITVRSDGGTQLLVPPAWRMSQKLPLDLEWAGGTWRWPRPRFR